MATPVAQRIGNCFNNVLTLVLFIIQLIGPTLTLALVIPLCNDYFVTKIALAISTCLLMILWFTINVKFWTDNKWLPGTGRYGDNCGDMFCSNPTKIKNLLNVGYLFYPAIPWTITNLACIGVWGDKLRANDVWIIILGTVGILYSVFLGNCLGYSLTKKYPNMGKVFKRFFSLMIYFTLFTMPIFGVAIPLITWGSYLVAWWTILVHGSLLALMGFVVPIVIWVQCGKDYADYKKNGDYGDRCCVEPTKFRSLGSGTFWLTFTCIWYGIVNAVCMGVWGQTFMDNHQQWLIGCSVGVPVAMALLGTAIGYGIFSVLYGYDEDYVPDTKKSSNPV